MFSCELFKIFKNAYFEEHLRTAASAKKKPLKKKTEDVPKQSKVVFIAEKGRKPVPFNAKKES